MDAEGVRGRGGSDPGVAAHDLLGPGLVVLAAVAIALGGSVLPWQQAILHLGAAALAFLAARRATATLAAAGAAPRVSAILALLGTVVGLGLLPVPASLARILAPGLVEARPGFRWLTLSVAPEATAESLTRWLLVASLSGLVLTWAHGGSRSVRRGATALAAATVALAGFAAGHALAGATEILGVLPVKDAPKPFFAPLVNPNHLGLVLVLGLPALLEVAVTPRPHRSLRPVAAWAGVALTAAVLVALGSPGVGLAAGVALLVWVWPRGTPARVAVVGIGLLGALFFAWTGGDAMGWAESSVGRRLGIWADLPRLFADFPGTGVGGMAFHEAFPAVYRTPSWTDPTFAHSDPLQWVVEHGVVGILAAIGAFFLARRVATSDEHERRWRRALRAGVAGVVVQSAVDFPLHVPGVLVVTVLVAGLAIWGRARRPAASGAPWRRLLVALGVAHLVAAGWLGRQALADRAEQTVAAAETPGPLTDAAASRVRRLAPWRALPENYAAWKALSEGRTEDAKRLATDVVQRWPHDAAALRRAAGVLEAAGAPEAAEAALRRSLERNGNDYRTWAALARLLTREERTDEALDAWVEAIRRWPWQYGDAHPLREAWNLLPLGVYWLDRLSDAPGFWSLELAKLLVEEGDDDTALLALEQAVRLRPAYVDSVGRALVLLRLGHVEEAESALRRMQQTRPGDPGVWMALGAVLEHQERYSEAAAVYAEAAERFRGLHRARAARVRALAAGGDVERAIGVGRGYLLTGESQPPVRIALAEVQADAGRPWECLEVLEPLGPRAGDAVERLRARCREACPDCEE